MIVLEQWYDIAEGDAAVLEVREIGASGWVRLEPVFGYPAPDGFAGEYRAWHEAVFDLTPVSAPEVVRLRLETDSRNAADGWFLRGFELYDGDVMPPRITLLEAPIDTQDVSGPYEVVVQIEEDGFVEDATLWWSAGGAASPLAMVEAGDHWSAAIPAVVPGTVVSWYVEASDGENLGRYPTEGAESFRVFLAAPGAPVRLDTQRVGQSVELRWDPPVSPHAVLGYFLWQEGASVAWAVESSEATLVLDPDLPTAVFVVAEYDVGTGDQSPTTSIEIAVPSLVELRPQAVFPGDHVRLTLDTRDLYMVAGEVTVSLGEGVRVDLVSVEDVGRAVLDVVVDGAAFPGERLLEVSGPQGDGVFEAALVVGAAADAPQVVSVSPKTLTQGRESIVTVTASVAFAGPVTIDAGEYMQLTSAPVTVGSTVVVGLTPSTRAPLGENQLVIDDGLRLWTTSLVVEDYVIPVQSGCSHGGTSALGLTLLALVCTRRREQVSEGDEHA
jgi:hypothetical protein